MPDGISEEGVPDVTVGGGGVEKRAPGLFGLYAQETRKNPDHGSNPWRSTG